MVDPWVKRPDADAVTHIWIHTTLRVRRELKTGEPAGAKTREIFILISWMEKTESINISSDLST